MTTTSDPAVQRDIGPITSRRRQRLSWALPALFTISWVVFVLVNGHVDRVSDQWRAAVTMVFGSFVAGSTPQGGGAVAFPVFTKVLEIPAAVARSFSLSIQATGMVMASLSILIAGRKVDKRGLLFGIVGGSAGFVFALLILTDRSTPFWSSHLPAPYVKVSFTVAIAALAYIVFLCFHEGAHGSDQIDDWKPRTSVVLLGFAFVGGIASALTGSGVDVFLFFFLVLVGGVHPKVGVPTSIIAMAFVSTLGFVILGLVDGQLSIVLNDAGQVVQVGDSVIEPASATRFDLYGIWLAATPIVVWGAPLGSWVASIMSDRRLIQFVGAMALLEVTTTIIFLDALHSDIALMAYGALGVALSLLGVRWLSRNRHLVI